MQMEEVALRIVYSCLWEPDRLAFRTSSLNHALLPVRCEFPVSHCIWDVRLRINGGRCINPVHIPIGICSSCSKFSCHAHTFFVYPTLPLIVGSDDSFETVRRAREHGLRRRALCLPCQVKEGYLSATQLWYWESSDPFAAPRPKPQY